MKLIDLHVHSTASDGSYTPSELINIAVHNNISAFALTDHDTVAGIQEAITVGKQHGIEVIPGIELSVEYKQSDIHMLGLFIDYKNTSFVEKLQPFTYSREERNKQMIKRLCDLGMPITMNDIRSQSYDGTITRMHFAKALVEKKYLKNTEDAFRHYIGDNGPAYVSRQLITPQNAIHLIKMAGGIPILAHPFLYEYTLKEIEELIIFLKNLGLEGIECYYSTHSIDNTNKILALANKYQLVASGGSDYHGSNKPHIQMGTGKGNLKISYDIIDKIRKKAST